MAATLDMKTNDLIFGSVEAASNARSIEVLARGMTGSGSVNVADTGAAMWAIASTSLTASLKQPGEVMSGTETIERFGCRWSGSAA